MLRRVLLLLSLLQTYAILAQTNSNLSRLTEAFANPPDDCRIMMRWWWFGRRAGR
jgi:hypothetical protein